MGKDIKKVSYRKFKRIILSDVNTGSYYCKKDRSYFLYRPQEELIKPFVTELLLFDYFLSIQNKS